MVREGLSPQQNAALIAWHLAHGESLTTAQVANMLGITWQGALLLLNNISGTIPIYRNDCGVWEVCAMQEAIT